MTVFKKKLLYGLVIWLILTIGGILIVHLLGPKKIQITEQTIFLAIMVGFIFSFLVVFTAKSEYFKPVPTEQKEKLKKFRQSQEFKKVRIIVIICLVLILLITAYILFYQKSQAWLIILVIPIIVAIFMGYYQSKLRKFFQQTAEYAQKLDAARISGLKRGALIGLIFGVLIILFLIIYFLILLNK